MKPPNAGVPLPRLRELREKKGWSGVYLAQISGVGLRTIKGLELGRGYGAYPSTIRNLCAALGCTWAELTGEEQSR